MRTIKMIQETTCTLDTVHADYDEDRALKALISEGDERAYAQIVGRYSTPVYRFLMRMIGSKEEAEDLTQETFYSFYKHRRNFQIDMDIHPYLFTIARRKAISYLRWRGVRKILTPLSLFHENTTPGNEIDAAESIDRKYEETFVREALKTLHPDKRAAVVLRFFEELSYSEIARIMNKPEGTVKSLVYRSERELRDRMTHRLGESRGES